MKFKSYNVSNDVSYTYDLAGNRLSAGAETYTYTHNRLDGMEYDAAGNVTSMVRDGVTLALTWNSQHQLVSVSTNGVFAESFAYDTLGRRISTTKLTTDHHSLSTEYHVYDGGECIADVDASGNPLRSYTWGPGIDNLLAMTVFSDSATNTYYAVKDHIGSVHALVDEQGQVVESYQLDAWGNVFGVKNGAGQVFAASTLGNRYLFQGREYSFATGLYNFRARWYDPATARWLSNDPIGISGGLNLYQFCGSNPVNYRDPDGLRVEIHSRWVQGLEGVAAHTYITVTDSKGQVNTWGSYKVNGFNEVIHNHPSYVGTLRTSSVTVPPPLGMTQDKWDRAVNLAGSIREFLQDQKYKLGGGDGGYESGNCHTTTRGILEDAGGGVPKGYNPPGRNPGL